MRFEQRLRALEARITVAIVPVTLYFADGSTRELRGPRNWLLRLFGGVFDQRNLSSGQAAQLDLIRRSENATEPGDGHLINLLRALPNSPFEEPERPAAIISGECP